MKLFISSPRLMKSFDKRFDTHSRIFSVYRSITNVLQGIFRGYIIILRLPRLALYSLSSFIIGLSFLFFATFKHLPIH